MVEDKITATVSHEEMANVLRIAYKQKIPYFISGGIGIGKSQGIRELSKEFAEKENRKFVDWNKVTKKEKLEIIDNIKDYFLFIDQRASQFDLGDFKLPQLDNHATENGYFEWRIPLVYYAICRPEAKGVLFFDEFTLSSSSVMGMFYSIINDRFIGEHKIADGIFIIGASNKAADVSYVNEMGNALKDRFEHMELKIPDIDEFTKYCMNNDIDPRIIGFLNFKPKYIYNIPKDSSEMAFPTPRGWSDRLSPLIKDIKSDKLDLLELIATTNIGRGVALEFTSFIRLSYDVDLDAILKDPKKIRELEEKEPDSFKLVGLKYSVLSSLSEKFRANNKLIENICKISEYLEKDYGIMLLRLCLSADKNGFTKIKKEALLGKHKAFKKFLEDNVEYLT